MKAKAHFITIVVLAIIFFSGCHITIQMPQSQKKEPKSTEKVKPLPKEYPRKQGGVEPILYTDQNDSGTKEPYTYPEKFEESASMSDAGNSMDNNPNDCQPKPDTASQKTIGSLTISKGVNSPTERILIGSNEALIASFLFSVKKEPLTISAFQISIAESGTIDTATDSRLYKLVDKNGKVYSGPWNATDLDSVSRNNSGAIIKFNAQMTLPIGDIELFLVANIAEKYISAKNDGLQAFLNPSIDFKKIKGMDSNKNIIAKPNQNIFGNIRMFGNSLFHAKMDQGTNQNTILNWGKNAHLANININAKGSLQDLNIQNIVIKAGNGGGFRYNANVSQMSNYKLFYGNTQIGETEQAYTLGSAGIGSIVFNIDKGFILKKDQQVTFKLVADMISLPHNTSIAFDISEITSVGQKTGFQVNAICDTTDSPAISIKMSGELMINLPSTTIFKRDVKVGSSTTLQYIIRARDEIVDITKISFWAGAQANSATPAANASINIRRVKVFNALGSLIGNNISPSLGKSDINISQSDLRVLNNQNSIITVEIQITQFAKVGDTFFIGIADQAGTGTNWGALGSYKVQAKGSASGVTLQSINDGSGKISKGIQITIIK